MPSLRIGKEGRGGEPNRADPKTQVLAPKVSKLHPRDAGPFNVETPKEPSREGTPRGGDYLTRAVLVGSRLQWSYGVSSLST